jgi:hypothetical protein
MPLGPLSSIPKEAWLALGAFAGAAATILVGWFNLRKSGDSTLASERAELSAGQREMIGLLRSEVDALHAHMADMDLALKAERESCDARIKELERTHKADIKALQDRMSREEHRGD